MRRERSTHRAVRTLSVVALLLALAPSGCWRGSPPGGDSQAPGNPADAHVTDITLGRALAADGTIGEDSRTNSYWTTDPFYVAVTTDGSVANATVKARWKFSDGSVVGEDSQAAQSADKPVLLQAKPPDGRWKAGDYTVEIFVNDVSAGTKDLVTR